MAFPESMEDRLAFIAKKFFIERRVPKAKSVRKDPGNDKHMGVQRKSSANRARRVQGHYRRNMALSGEPHCK